MKCGKCVCCRSILFLLVMNVFFLSLIPALAARWHCDKHVVKMVLEAVQILYTAHWIRRAPDVEWVNKAPLNVQGKRGYKKTHVKHPSVLWTIESKANYVWLCELTKELNNEYSIRYGKKHSVDPHVKWLENNIPPYGETEQAFTPPKIAMTPDCKEYAKENNLDAVEAYHHYYITKKLHFLYYRNLEIPPFLQKHLSAEENFNRLGLVDPLSRGLVESALKKQVLNAKIKEAYGVDSAKKEELLLKAVAMQKEPTKKWNDILKNGVRITNAVRRVLGKDLDSLRFQTVFDKQVGKRKRTAVEQVQFSDSDFSEEDSEMEQSPPKKQKLEDQLDS